MGKPSRKEKTSSVAPKLIVQQDEREALSKMLLSRLAEQQLTIATAPDLGAILPKLKRYTLLGERTVIDIGLADQNCRVHALLPKYAAERPTLRIEPY